MAEELLNDVDKAILLLNIPNIYDLSMISDPITIAATRTRTRLLITIFSSFFDIVTGSSSWDAVQKLLTHAYVQATTVSQKHNKFLMCIDVLLRGVQSHATEESPMDDWNMVFYSGTSSSCGL
jgi:pantetheine-phosphate adenylyltransferase